MRFTLTLSTDESIALRMLAHEIGKEPAEALQAVARDWLIGHGYLELPIDEETETEGEA